MILWLKAVPRLVWEAVGFVVLFLVANWALSCHDANVRKEAQQKAAVDSGTAHIANAVDTLRIKDSTVVHNVTTYHDVRGAVIAAHPNDTSVTKLVQSCDQIVVSCADQRKAAQIVIDSQTTQIKRLAAMKALTPPRLDLFGEVLRDIPNNEWIGRAGAEYRVLGPISVEGIVEAHPKGTKASGLLGLRYTFR